MLSHKWGLEKALKMTSLLPSLIFPNLLVSLPQSPSGARAVSLHPGSYLIGIN